MVAALAAVLAPLDTALNIAFPALTDHFDLDVTAIQWVVVAYVLPNAGLLLVAGRVADRVGHRMMVLAGLVVSSVALVATGAAPTFGFLLVARVVQGIGAAMVQAAAPALVTRSVPATLRGRALGLLQMSAAVGLAVGPLVGGVLVAGLGWRSVFWFRVPLCLVLGATVVAVGRVDDHGDDGDARLDLSGVTAMAVAVVAALLALSQAGSSGVASLPVIGLAVAAVAAGVVFVARERQTAAPLVDLRLLASYRFAMANGLSVVANAAMFATWLLVPYYVVDVLGTGAGLGGLLLMVSPLATALVAPPAGWLADRLGTALVSTVGLVVETAGLALLAVLGPGSARPLVAVALALVGAGLSLFSVPNMSFVMGAIDRDRQGVAGGLAQTMRTIGVVAGVAVWSALFTARRLDHAAELGVADDGPLSFMPAFGDTFAAAAALCGLAAVASLIRRAVPTAGVPDAPSGTTRPRWPR